MHSLEGIYFDKKKSTTEFQLLIRIDHIIICIKMDKLKLVTQYNNYFSH